MDKELRIAELEEVITTLDTYFESGNDCICPIDIFIDNKSLTRSTIKKGDEVSDAEYDVLRAELKQLSPGSYIFKTVTASDVIPSSKQIIHNPPMSSISKCNGTLNEKNDTLKKWLKDCSLELSYKSKENDDGIPYFVQSLKRDGVAVSIEYENGELKQAGLRPRDGIHGEDVTENIRYVAGVLEKLPLPLTMTIRGELECKISTFEQIVVDYENGDNTAKLSRVPANPRNYTAGSIRQFDDPTITKLRKISFTGHSIENLDNAPYKTEIERAKWCNKVLGIPFVQVRPFKYSDLAKIESKMDDLDYEIDGIVLAINILEDQEQLGRHGDRPTGNPRGKIAWKFSEKKAYPVIKNILWQTGRTGKVTPVSQFDPVKLAGTQVSQCTLHNVGLVIANGFGVGAEIVVIKSGKIIPKVIGVKKKADKVEYPDTCPSCGSTLEMVKGKDASELFCRNSTCPAQNVGRLTHYLERIGVKGIGESKANELISNGVVKRISDFYKLDIDDVVKRTNLSERQSTLICSQIRMIKNPEKIKENAKLKAKIAQIDKVKIPIENFIAALGMEGSGRGVARILVSAFNADFDKIRTATEEDLSKLDGIGPIIAKSVSCFFKDNNTEIDELLNYIELELPKTGKFTGKSFCFTGTLPEPRKELEQQVKDLGGKCSSSVSKKTDYVIIGLDAGSKADKAKKLNIPQLTYEKFKGLIEE